MSDVATKKENKIVALVKDVGKAFKDAIPNSKGGKIAGGTVFGLTTIGSFFLGRLSKKK